MKIPLSGQHSVLLASASSGGTIAAVRDLGRNGIGAQVLSSTRLDAAAWSRHTSRTYSAPAEIDHELFFECIIAIGKATPGLVLLPTSDQTAWIYTANAAALAQYFLMYQPSLECIRRILDKKLLMDAAVRAGLDVLPSWDPETSDELSKLIATFPYPMLIKPRTHVQRLRNDKGVVVETPDEFWKQYEAFLVRERYLSAPPAQSIGLKRPLLQQFAADGSQDVQSITGFIDRTGELFVSRRSVKVFQRSRPIGIGICHEALPPSRDLSRMVYTLCRELNYFGVFEAEFIRFNERWAMIDFNPRFYNQLGFDIQRGMPLPLLAFLDASGQADALSEAVAKAQVEHKLALVFSDRFTLNSILLAQGIASGAPHADRQRWWAWSRQHATHCVDIAIDKSDPLPAIVHALSEIYLGVRALPRFVRATRRKSLAPVATAEKVLS
ncbi:ATP-grasp domain-containing protein [Bradyrhizobium sp. USDA 4449]